MSHRALILASLAKGESTIQGLLESKDVLATARALSAFGVKVERQSEDCWSVTGSPWRSPECLIDCGNSGTSARLLIGAAAGQDLVATFTGDRSLRTRPMAGVIAPLIDMGAGIIRSCFLPVTLRGARLKGISHKTAVPSAQIKSAVLLAGLQTDEMVEVTEPLPSRDHSERMLKHLGCEIEIEERRDGHAVRLGRNRALHGRPMLVPGDPSSAAFAIVAALVTRGSEVRVEGIIDNPSRSGLIETLVEMGADLEFRDRRTLGGVEVMDVIARSSSLKGVRVPASRAPAMIDEYPILGVAAAFARGETIMEGISELRVKESDRLAAIQSGLRRCGTETVAKGDCLHVLGDGAQPRGGAEIETKGDHRIAMAFLILGLGARKPVTVDQAGMIATSFPDFDAFMRDLGAEIVPC